MSHLSFLKLWPLLLIVLLVATGCRSSRSLRGERFVLVVDAGHGGNDQGASGRRSLEKEVNLKVARRVCKLIRKQCRDVEVIQTRPDDEFISLNDRAGMANFYRADLFISIHSNSARGWAEGTETFIHPSARGSRSERESRGVKTANFAVLRNTRMPAVLTEIGFISNRSEERFMNSRKGQKRLARSISNAFIRYRRSVP